ncbi:MAG: hypothetical protein AAF616_07300 [Bacteroidota bacterium]
MGIFERWITRTSARYIIVRCNLSNLKRILYFLLHLTLILLLTILTQVGGVVYLLTLILTRFFKLSRTSSVAVFLGIYLVSTFLIIPLIAPIFERTALPLTGNLRPLNFGTCLLNRHYVTPQLKNQVVSISDQLENRYKGTCTNYLVANFPFVNGFPLFPHLSHNDGKKLDLAFFYKRDSDRSNKAPSFIGYGVFEDPKKGESNYPADCEQRGYWQYGLLSSVVPQWNKKKYQLDVERTTELIKLLSKDELTSKIFIEPHLKQRWRLNRLDNIRFHGCQAVRHDDHIHTQIK